MAWNKSEERQLVELHNNDVPLGQMAETLGKSEDAVSSKIKRLRDAGRLEDRERQREASAQGALIAANAKLRREKTRLSNQIGNWELLMSRVTDYASMVPVPSVPKFGGKQKPSESEVVAVLSDCHALAKWDREVTDGFSEYNFEIFLQRLWYFGQEIVRLSDDDRSKYGLRKLHVDMLGDIVQGTLRLEDLIHNEDEILPGCIMVASVLYQWLLGLLEHFETIEVRCVAGNHGRQDSKPQAGRYVETNYDSLIYLQLKMLAAQAGLQDRLQIIVPKSRKFTFERLGHRIKIAHGDHIKGGGGISGVPIFGLSRDMLRAFRTEVKAGRDAKLDLLEIGHFHEYTFLQNTLVINGAMCPPSPWAYDELGAVSDSTQLIYYTSPKYTIGWRLPVSFKHCPSTHGFVVDELWD